MKLDDVPDQHAPERAAPRSEPCSEPRIDPRIDQYATHEVLNQPGSLADYNA